jgi:hypothetical protein
VGVVKVSYGGINVIIRNPVHILFDRPSGGEADQKTCIPNYPGEQIGKQLKHNIATA